MSETAPVREWRFYLDDMIRFCRRVLEFTRGMDQTRFTSDAMCFDATIRNIELLGEAAIHIPEMIRVSSPAVPWRKVIATRNRLIHAYLGIDNDTLWSIVETDVPALLIALQDMKASL